MVNKWYKQTSDRLDSWLLTWESWLTTEVVVLGFIDLRQPRVLQHSTSLLFLLVVFYERQCALHPWLKNRSSEIGCGRNMWVLLSMWVLPMPIVHPYILNKNVENVWVNWSLLKTNSNPLVKAGFPWQWASGVESISMPWCDREIWLMSLSPWWRHQMETFFVLLAFCAGNSPVTDEFPSQRPVTWSFHVLIGVWINAWVNNHEAGDLRRHHTHYDAIVMVTHIWIKFSAFWWKEQLVMMCLILQQAYCTILIVAMVSFNDTWAKLSLHRLTQL